MAKMQFDPPNGAAVDSMPKECLPPAVVETLPWEEIEPGRYRPLRTRGSFPGRELG